MFFITTGRILAVALSEHIVQRPMSRTHLPTLFEKALGRHREKLRLVRSAVRIQQRGLPLSRLADQPLIFGPHHALRLLVPAATLPRRPRVGEGVKHVELVGKFVNHDVSPVIVAEGTG